MTDRKGDGMLERIAKALVASYVKSSGTNPAETERVWETGKEGWLDAARAALMAMRDVSDELADVGADYGGECYGQEVPCMRRAWTAMIDAILAESDTPCPTAAHTVG